MSTAIQKANTAVTSALTTEQMADVFQRLVIGSDLATLSKPEQVEYYKLVCDRLGLDPYRKPFDLIVLNGKLQMYPNKECTAQLTSTRGMNVTILSRQRIGDHYVVTARAEAKDGAASEDDGVTTLSGGTDAIANAMMKAVTKAKRRAVLSACGLGMVDESELETIENVEAVEPLQIEPPYTDEENEAVTTWLSAIESADNAEELTKVAVQIKTLPQVVKDAVKVAMGQRGEALKVKWVKDKFVELT